ncbi:MAG TPA: hypothetical protein VMT57_01395 [Candidatus Thermoplasmatota archaeon]|nr:hypothetical protein [Candidatus Thermoplasmatota archaeon]
MRDVTKAQLTIGLLAYFATIWDIALNRTYANIPYAIGVIVLQLVLLLILSYVIIAMLEWVKVFDLKTNAILTLFVLVTLNLLTTLHIP